MDQKFYKKGDTIGKITLIYNNKTFTSEDVHLGKDDPGYFTAYDLKATDEGGGLDYLVAFGFPKSDNGEIDQSYDKSDGLTPVWQAKFGDQVLTAETGHLQVSYRNNFNNASGKVDMTLDNGRTLSATFDTNNTALSK
ncbi:MAG TPA: hypothetical protein VJ889_05205 [Pseudomonas sp.]|nr:hypothetical protein [Pseudomonas sp.]